MTSTTAIDTLTANKRLAVRLLDQISDGDIVPCRITSTGACREPRNRAATPQIRG